MKRFLLTAAVLALSASVADACPTLGAGRLASVVRTVRTARTVTTTRNVQTVTMVPVTRTVEKTVLVPTKVMTTETVNVPVVTSHPVTTSRTSGTYRGREVVRGVVALPLRVVRGVLPCR